MGTAVSVGCHSTFRPDRHVLQTDRAAPLADTNTIWSSVTATAGSSEIHMYIHRNQLDVRFRVGPADRDTIADPAVRYANCRSRRYRYKADPAVREANCRSRL